MTWGSQRSGLQRCQVLGRQPRPEAERARPQAQEELPQELAKALAKALKASELAKTSSLAGIRVGFSGLLGLLHA